MQRQVNRLKDEVMRKDEGKPGKETADKLG
jgi:hypothetical protein